jgi:hypothetical protein
LRSISALETQARRVLVGISTCALAFVFPSGLVAQSLTFTGAQSTVTVTPVSPDTSISPFGAAVDAGGDLFVADNANNDVVEAPAGGGAKVTLGTSRGICR